MSQTPLGVSKADWCEATQRFFFFILFFFPCQTDKDLKTLIATMAVLGKHM